MFKRIVALVAGLLVLISFIGLLHVGFGSARKQKMLNNLRELDAAIYELELSPAGTQRNVFVSLDEGVAVCDSSTAESTFNAEVQGQNVWIVWQDGGISKLSPTDYGISVSFSTPVSGPGFFEFVLTRGAGGVIGVQASKIDT